MPRTLSPTFFSVDLILTPKGDVKILEFNRGLDSGFYGYESLTQIDLWVEAMECMAHYYGIKQGGLYYDQVDWGMSRLPVYLRPISELTNSGRGAMILPSGKSDIGNLRRLYPHAIVVDGSVPMMAAFKNKAIFERLFRGLMPELLPYGQVVSTAGGGCSYEFLKHISDHGQGVVIKTPEGMQGSGVNLYRGHEGVVRIAAERLKLEFQKYSEPLADGSLPLMAEDAKHYKLEHEVRVVQALHKSKIIKFQGGRYHSCIRVGILAMPTEDESVMFNIVGGYHKPSISEVKENNEAAFKSSVGQGKVVRAKALTPGEVAKIEAELSQKGFIPAVIKVMEMEQSDMMLHLLTPLDGREIGAALYGLFSRGYFDDYAVTRAEHGTLNAALLRAMQAYPEFKRQIYLRLIRGDDVLMPETFKGTVQRQFYKDVWLCQSGRDAITQSWLINHTMPLSHGAGQRQYEIWQRFEGRRLVEDKHDVSFPSHFLALVTRDRQLKNEMVIRAKGAAAAMFNPQPFTAPFYCAVKGCIKKPLQEPENKPVTSLRLKSI